MASPSNPSSQEAAIRRQNKGPPYKFLVPLIYAPVLPLIRLSLRKNPVLRDRLFTIVLAGAFAHGFYLVYPFQISYPSCVTVQSDSAFLLLIDCVVNVLITIAALHRICCVAYENWRLLFSFSFIIILLWLPGCQITTTLLLFHDLGQARNKIYETKHSYKWSYFYS
ncbi:hypothetical protein SO802_000913 [Lithocarpus litseifolius]|uniref:Uncharacterized protein n=1 Tax=Lithocarpus litseifolius TaxID=425828 RepID=A0AAW2DUN7_9ROSI